MKVSLFDKYRTRDGKEVELIMIVPKNSAGNIVTFPVKGTVIEKKGKRTIRHYHIWTMEGRSIIFGDHPFDLIKEG